MRSIEKIENNVWSWGNLSFNTVILNGRKNGKEERLDAFYLKTYDSEAYTNMRKLDSLSINYRKFLVISYKGYNDDNFEMLELFLNFSNVNKIKSLFTEAYESIADNAEKIYGKNKLTAKGEDLVFQEENIIPNKDIGIIPEMLEDSNGRYQPGVVIIMQDTTNPKSSLQVDQAIPFNVFEGLVELLQTYDLLAESRAASIEGLLYKLLDRETNGEENDEDDNKLRSRNSGTRKPTRFSGGIKKKGIFKNSLDDEDEDEEDIEVEIDEDEEEEKPKKFSKKSSTSKKSTTSSTKKNKKIVKDENISSMDDMMKAGENFEFSLEDGEEEDGETF